MTGIKCDLAKTEEIDAMFAEIKRVHGGVDICINNAGYSGGTPLLSKLYFKTTGTYGCMGFLRGK